jgi:hypothetical protein
VWGRTYSFPGRRPVLVSSTKVVDASGRLMEVVRGGLGMTLQLSVQDAALCFRSTGYFVEIAGLRAPIPGWLTPGVADVRHSDGGDGAFRFTLAFRPPVARGAPSTRTDGSATRRSRRDRRPDPDAAPGCARRG